MPRHAFKFTQAAVDKLKPPASGRIDFSNTVIPGMQLRVSASGKKVYRVKTRIDGVQVPTTIGSAAVFSLGEANKAAREFLRQAAEGINPVAQRRQRQAEEAAVVAALFDRYLRQHASKRMCAEYYAETKRAIERDVLPTLGELPIDKLTRRQIRDVIDAIAERAAPYAAHVLRYFGAFLGWVVRQDILESNPAAGIPDPDTRRKEERERDRWLDDSEIPLFWFACNKVGGVFGPPFRLLLLLGPRRDELIQSPWSEWDLDRQTWVLPGPRDKNGEGRDTHLAEPALAILRSLPRLRPADPTEHLFSTTGGTPVSGYDSALKRVRAEMTAMAGRPIQHFTLHDLRRTIASGMAELGVAESIVDRVLGHRSARGVSAVARIYNRSTYARERRDALELWSRHIVTLVKPRAIEEEIVKA
jgi:integrase